MERRVDGELAGTKSVAVAVAALAVPIMVLVVGSYYTNAMKEREVSGKFVELAEQCGEIRKLKLVLAMSAQTASFCAVCETKEAAN